MPEGAWGRVLAHLVRFGHLDGPAALAGRIGVQPARGSNQVGVVCIDGRPALVLKRSTVALGPIDPFRAERDAYRWLASRPSGPELAPELVAVVDETLVLEALGGLEPLHHRLHSSGDVAPLLETLGRRLAAVHSDPPDRQWLLPRRPWVLDVPRGHLPDLFSPDPDMHALAAEIADDAALRAVLEELARTWRPLAPIHGDVKFDNVLVRGPGPGGGPHPRTDRDDDPRLVLIDWELAGLGLPAWDVAGLLDGVVVPALQTGGPDELDVALRPALGAVAAHRSAVRGRLAPDDRSLLVATVARLIQSSLQLHAMRQIEPACSTGSRRVLEGARALADRIEDRTLETAWVA